jgi:hypothetical protein
MTATNITRPDGRPEAYDTLPASHEGVMCVMCLYEKKISALFRKGEVFMCSPIDSADGQAHWVCKGHMPKNVVIYDPATDLCRDLDGETVWHEGTKN